jgi:EAL domain-containing protein (putative c-di-GMP-specific phosphodiesterase class I)/DNA-binding NarL/FixJ family response regulator
MRVLVFDDDPAIGRLLVKTATMSGLDAVAVTTANAFAEQLQSAPPQVILLDLQLGATDGVEQLRWLADRQYAGTLVLMSGFDARVLCTARALGQTLGLKIEDAMLKPLRVAELEQIFERLRAADRPPTIERLREAIANDEMGLDFQPIVTRNPKVVRKMEALVRWDHPVIGRILPDQFLPVAEHDAATIDALTDWVVGAIVDAYQVLNELGINVSLAMNVSGRSLGDLTLPDRIEQRLRAGGMPPEHLIIEITEGVAYENPSRMMGTLSRLRLKGIRVSIDDFGTGYSSLKVLLQMPFSGIKIDRSFVSEMTSRRDARVIVKSIIDLAANMEIACVAEGVETEEAADLLEQLGVRDLQGYFIARPMPVEDVAAWMAKWTEVGPATPRGQDRGASHEPAKAHDDEKADAPSAPSAAATGSDAVRLPPRQLEVMQLLAEGCSVKEIARRLNLGIGTVKVHLSLAYSALGAHNRIEAIRRAGAAILRPRSE